MQGVLTPQPAGCGAVPPLLSSLYLFYITETMHCQRQYLRQNIRRHIILKIARSHEQRVVAEKTRTQTFYEDNFLPCNSIFLLLPALLMLMVLIYVRKKREKGE